MEYKWYFTYGNNIFPEHKKSQTGKILEKQLCRLKNYRLSFNKHRNSREVFANIIPEETEEVWGVAYFCSPDVFQDIEDCEVLANSHYIRSEITVKTKEGQLLKAEVHVPNPYKLCIESSPSEDFLKKFLKWAKRHDLHQQYIDSIKIRAGFGSCPEHQRLWREHCVDRNLKNEWLEQLNNLNTLNLISVCEGHLGHPRRYCPRINLRIKADLIEVMAEEWQKVKPVIRGALERCFPYKDMNPSIELHRQIQIENKDALPDDDIIIYINSRILPNTDWPKELTDDWFERSISSISIFDESIRSIVFMGMPN